MSQERATALQPGQQSETLPKKRERERERELDDLIPRYNLEQYQADNKHSQYYFT